jgi:hypothetical protein
MKAKTLRNSQAFPNDFEHEESLNIETGLTKREYFAAMAMQGIAAEYIEVFETTSTISGNAVAKFSVMLADELINELNK